MILEKEFEDIIFKYPELIEDGLIAVGRQVNVDRKFIDLLFKDKFGQDLIVELKIGIAKRMHVAQLMDYAGYKIAEDKTPVRIMLVANRIPENFKHSSEYFGFEYKELTLDKLREFLIGKNDQELLSILLKEQVSQENFLPQSAISKPSTVNESKSAVSVDKTERNQTRQGMASRIRSGKLFNQAKCAIELLNSSQDWVDMKKIISFMSAKGYHSKTYYDLFNSLVDSELVEQAVINGSKVYRLRRDT